MSIRECLERLESMKNEMKYLCLVYLDHDKLHAVPDRECLNCGDGLRKSGLLVAAEALESTATAATVELGVVTTDIHGNGSFMVVIGPIASGTYHVEFQARNGAGCNLIGGAGNGSRLRR